MGLEVEGWQHGPNSKHVRPQKTKTASLAQNSRRTRMSGQQATIAINSREFEHQPPQLCCVRGTLRPKIKVRRRRADTVESLVQEEWCAAAVFLFSVFSGGKELQQHQPKRCPRHDDSSSKRSRELSAGVMMQHMYMYYLVCTCKTYAYSWCTLVRFACLHTRSNRYLVLIVVDYGPYSS